MPHYPIRKANRIELFNFSSPSMRAFHMSWFAFFLCFFGWFGIAPLMVIIRDELGLSKVQIGNTIIASVAFTILARLVIGTLCDKLGPRLTYTWLLILGGFPVMGIGLAHSYESFLLFRLGIGLIGASFVITQYHTSIMFAPNCVGTANATTAGWGNMGGGATQILMPVILAAVMTFGVESYWGWRIAMIVPGVAMVLTGVAYWKLTQDTMEGNFKDLRKQGRMESAEKTKGTFLEACRDHRVWVLFLVYGACFGMELTICNIAALYFRDYFGLGLKAAGLVAGSYGMMNLFSRSLGGVCGDRIGMRWGLKGRATFLGLVLLAEGLTLIVFSQITTLAFAIATLILFSLFVQMSSGATYSIVPFINQRALGSVAGIVGAGGNAGAVAAGFLMRSESLSWPTALMILGMCVVVSAGMVSFVRFSEQDETEARDALQAQIASDQTLAFD